MNTIFIAIGALFLALALALATGVLFYRMTDYTDEHEYDTWRPWAEDK